VQGTVPAGTNNPAPTSTGADGGQVPPSPISVQTRLVLSNSGIQVGLY